MAIARCGPLGERAGHRRDGGVELGGRHDAVDEPEPQRLLRIDALRKQQHLHCLAQADDARQRPGAAAVGCRRDVAVRGREIGVVGGDREVAGAQQRQAEAGDGAARLRDGDRRHPVQMLDRGMQALDHRLELRAPRLGRVIESGGEAAQIAACHEVPARAAHDDDPQRRVCGQRGGSLDQRVHHREIERVERFGAIERQRRDRAVALDQDGIGHRGPRGNGRRV